MEEMNSTGEELLKYCGDRKFKTVYADPPWQFSNRSGKIAPENKRLTRYGTMTLDDIKALPINAITEDEAHMYLWVPNALLPQGLEVLKEWGFTYKTNLIWEKIRKDGQPDGRGVGFYFRNVTEILLFGVKTKRKGDTFRTLQPGRSQVNLLRTMKREHSRKPDEFIQLIESCSPGPYIELFARGTRPGWTLWGDQATNDYEPTWNTYANHTIANKENEEA